MWEYATLDWQSFYQLWRFDEREWKDMLVALNELGAEGWEAVSVVWIPGTIPGSPIRQYVLLKRSRQ